MLNLRCNIEIGGWEYDFVNSVEITSGWDMLSDKCTIVLPRNITYKRDDVELTDTFSGDDPIFRLGDLVVVKLGYGRDAIPVRFTGYIVDVKVDRPVTIMCEDAMYWFKQTFVDLSRKGMEVNYNNLTLDTLIDFILGNSDLTDPFNEEDITFKGFQGEHPVDITINDRAIGEVQLDNIRIPVTTIALVLEYLRKKYGIVSYFRTPVDGNGDVIPDPNTGGIKQFFVCGLPYTTENGFKATLDKSDKTTPKYTVGSKGSNFDSANVIPFEFAKNIISDRELVYKKAKNIPVYVVANSKQKDNTVKTSFAGVKGGDVVTLNFPDQTQEQLDEFVADRVAKARYEGFSGSMEAFLEPRVIHGQAVSMKNLDVADNNGEFLVKKVVTMFSTQGGRQSIELHNKIEDA